MTVSMDLLQPSGRGLFITGTDTCAGKTYVTAALARLLRQQGRSVRVCKPVATGAAWVDGRWLSDDTRLLAETAGTPVETVTIWSFSEPAAPPVASRLASIELRLEPIVAAVRQQLDTDALTLVEGVGGLLCPLTERETVADLVARLALPVVVVARRSLGTLNHTLLTLEVARARGLPVAGLVVTEATRSASVAEETCIDELRRRITVPLLAVLPFQAGPEALANIDWWGLAGSRRHC